MATSRRAWCLAAALVLSLPAAACTTSRPLPMDQRYISINYPVWASDDEMMSGMRAEAARTCPGYRVVAARIVPIGVNHQPKHVEAIIDCASPLPAAVLNDKVERLVRYIVVKDADEMRRIHDNVASGQDFAIAARASLDARTRARGGEVGYVVYSEMNPATGDVIFHLPIGQVSDPIRTNQGWEIYQVVDERPVPAKAPPRHGPPRTGAISGSGEEKGLKLYSSGSGFFVSKTGALLTNNHVVDGCKAMRADVAGGRVKGRVLRTDPVNDLAVILFDATPAAVASFRDGPYVRPGDSVVAAGFPLPDVLAPELNVTTGAVSSLAGLGGNSAFVQITAPIQPGNSGGPLLDASGGIVGVVESKLDARWAVANIGTIPENINFAVKSSVARTFLEDAGYQPLLAHSTRTLSAADVGDMARAFTVRVECWK